MHELALCRGIVEALAEQAERHGFVRVLRVRLEIGALAAVEPEALRFGFDVAARGGVAEGAALEIIETPGEAWCFACGRLVTIARRLAPCPECGGETVGAKGGDALRIKDLEVE